MASATDAPKNGVETIDPAADSESGEKKLPFPKSILFIVGNEFCERFSFYGMKAILSIYFKSKLKFSEDTATVIYHAFSMLCYFTPIFGAMLADQFFGKFKTIMWISLIYVLGHAIKTVASIPHLGLPPAEFSILGLVLIALGTGGIKPCVSAFGGDQFKMPEQGKQLGTFFLVFYFAINAGSLISTALTPILREDVSCFGDDTCYPLAFGVPAILMLIATAIFVMGKPLYIIKLPEGNITTKVIGSISTGIYRRAVSKEKKVIHWLDHAKEQYGNRLVEDTKVLLRLLVLYCPIPLFWALFDQQGSRWTFQAQRTNGMVGNYLIKPDQMQIVNPFMILIMIPLFDRVLYPLLARYNLLTKPLRRIAFGGVLTSIAFFISGFLELSLMKTYEHLPKAQESHLHIMNTMDCSINVRIGQKEEKDFNHDIDLMTSKVIFDLDPNKEYHMVVQTSLQFAKCRDYKAAELKLRMTPGSVTEVIVVPLSNSQIRLSEVSSVGDPKKTENSYPKLRFLLDYPESAHSNISLQDASGYSEFSPPVIMSHGQLSETQYIQIPPAMYDVWIGDTKVATIDFLPGGVHSLVIRFWGPDNLLVLNDFLLTNENTIHMLWLIPQYVIITAGEIMFSITGLQFSYSQAPASMKSVVQAAWLLTVAFGNVIVIVVAEAKAFDNQATEFFLFGILMLVDMVLFSLLAYRYKCVDNERSCFRNDDVELE